MDSATFWQIILLLIATGIGMGSGSFCTMIYYRSSKGEPWGGKWTGKRAYCPKCGHKLRTRDLLPLFNWLLTKGKCHFCSAKINPVYFFIELGCTLLSIIAFLKFDIGERYMLAVIMSSALVVLLATSYSYNKLPDSVLMVVVVPGLVYRALVDGQIFDVVFTTTITCLLAFAFAEAYKKSQGKKLKNFSHLKFFAVAGVWVSLPEFLYFLPMVIFFTFLSAILADKYERKPAPYLTASIAIPILYAVLR